MHVYKLKLIFMQKHSQNQNKREELFNHVTK